MSNSFFQFKQFSIFHDKCAMKVGTDGVLLGSWVNCINNDNILDVGSGSGLISLMLAQRSKALICAIDIDDDAFEQTLFNAANSPFSNRIEVIHSSLQCFSPEKTFDLIVSNPPYFINSLKSPGQSRSTARHDDNLPLAVFFEKSQDLLTKGGRIAVILPFDLLEYSDGITSDIGLHKIRETLVRSLPDSPPKRVLLEYSRQQLPPEKNEMYIELSRHVYSDEYITLTKDFYLKM